MSGLSGVRDLLARPGISVASPAPMRWRLLLWVLIAAGFTALVIQYSFSHGRLACPPFFDDVVYFEDALRRLEVLYHSGVGRLLSDYRAWPAHSPFSSFLAMGAFAVLGIHDWAPYVANGLIVLALLAFVDFLAGDLPLGRKVLPALLVLCIPIASETVCEFRPGVPSALCAAMGAAMLLTRSFSRAGWRYRAGAGALFGLALLFKPPTFPLTLTVFVAAVVVAAATDRLLLRARAPALARAAWQCTLPAVLAPLPHYLLTWRETLDYIYQPLFGPANPIWRSHGTLGWHLRYYLTGEGGHSMLGLELPVILGVIGIGLAALLARRRWTPALRILGFLIVALAAYALPTAMSVKQRFFGSTFAWILVFALVYVLALLLRKRGWAPLAAGALVLLCGFRQARMGPHLYARGSPVVIERTRLVNGIYHALLAHGLTPETPVYVTTTGYVNASVLDYCYRRDTLQGMHVSENAFSGDLQVHQRAIAQADYVIASESGTGDAFAGNIPSGNVQDQTLALVRANKSFKQIAAFPTLSGRRYFLFGRVRAGAH